MIYLIFRQYQFPDCHFSIPLICDFNPTAHIQTTVEVYGEIRLINKFDGNNSSETSHSLISKISNYQTSLEEGDVIMSSNSNSEADNQGRLENKINSIKNMYVPSIHVHSIRTISNAREIIKENLRFRMTRNIKNRKLKKHANWASLQLFDFQGSRENRKNVLLIQSFPIKSTK